MEHANSLESVNLSGARLTIGAFDGVHKGHQKILQEMQGREPGPPIVVLTFYPHPKVVLQGRRPSFYLSTPEEKAALLSEHGADLVITETFDDDLANVSAEDFVQNLVNHLEPHSLWVGPDFALGHNREGNVPYLRARGRELGFDLQVVEPLRMSGEVVSSSRIREALRSGDVARAARYLGRPFEIPGEVTKGAGRGKQLGIPTANLSIWPERAYPRKGVYACFASVGEGWLPAVTNVGIRPTFEQEAAHPVVEAHLLDYTGSDLYGQTVRLQFIDRLRDERRFEGPEALLDQIQEDISQGRQILAEYDPNQSS